MIHALFWARLRLPAFIVWGVAALAVAAPAHAAGSSMPWEAPLQAIGSSLVQYIL